MASISKNPMIINAANYIYQYLKKNIDDETKRDIELLEKNTFKAEMYREKGDV